MPCALRSLKGSPCSGGRESADMPRPRTGSLRYTKKQGYCARITRTVDGTSVRDWEPLGTHDPRVAKRKLVRLVSAVKQSAPPEQLRIEARREETVAEYFRTWIERRKAAGKVSAIDEESYLSRYVLPAIGGMELSSVRPAHVRAVLDDAVGKGSVRYRARRPLAKLSIRHIRGAAFRMFKAAWQEELIQENPVARVDVPEMREVRRERTILTDAEFEQYISSPRADLELRLMALVSRVLGGMRSGDVCRWDWQMIDLLHFAEATIPRAKTGQPQTLAVPDSIRPVLRHRWELAGRPATGPVFPVQRGPQKGGFRAKRGTSFAKRLRRDLQRAGLTRRELFQDTPLTRAVDFHSFRRAFSTALATANVNAQRAVRLAGHSDEKVHMRYVMSTPEMRTIPVEIVPKLPVGFGTLRPRTGVLVRANSSGPAGTRTRDLRIKRTKEDGGGVAEPSQSGPNDDDSAVRARDDGPTSADLAAPVQNDLPNPTTPPDGVEVALAAALTAAATAGDLETVKAIVAELEARRTGRRVR